MNILQFPETPRTGDRHADPVEESRVQDAGPGPSPALSDARILRSLCALNRPVLAAVLGRRPRAQSVLAAFRAEWTPPAPRTPRPANDMRNH